MIMGNELWTIHFTKKLPWNLRPIKIENLWNKPLNGLWVSPLDAVEGWEAWCRNEHYDGLGYRVYLLVDMERALVVNSAQDLEKLSWTQEFPDGSKMPMEVPDFQSMKIKGVDVIHLTSMGQWGTRFSGMIHGPLFGHNLYGWDCDCLLIMHERAVKAVRKRRPKSL